MRRPTATATMASHSRTSRLGHRCSAASLRAAAAHLPVATASAGRVKTDLGKPIASAPTTDSRTPSSSNAWIQRLTSRMVRTNGTASLPEGFTASPRHMQGQAQTGLRYSSAWSLCPPSHTVATHEPPQPLQAHYDARGARASVDACGGSHFSSADPRQDVPDGERDGSLPVLLRAIRPGPRDLGGVAPRLRLILVHAGAAALGAAPRSQVVPIPGALAELPVPGANLTEALVQFLQRPVEGERIGTGRA